MVGYQPLVYQIDEYESKQESLENQRKKLVDKYEDCKEAMEELFEQRSELYKEGNQLEINDKINERVGSSKLSKIDDEIFSIKRTAEEYANQIKVIESQITQLERDNDNLFVKASSGERELEEYVQELFRETMSVTDVDTHKLHKAQTEIAEELYMYKKNSDGNKEESTDKWNFIHAIQQVLKENGTINQHAADEFIGAWEDWKNGRDIKMVYIIEWLTEYRVFNSVEAELAKSEIKELVEKNNFKNKMRGVYDRSN